ncbi:MAG: L-aspartate oxidase [Betaproteobacteria bacterium]|nr:MAG: L-aspartate oxidase [Betaproteobacteria bacterium]
MSSLRQNSGRVVVIGGGIAGLATALRLAPLPTTLIAKAALGTEASTPWAQGGIAAAIGKDDAPALHLADTLAAGAGLCDPAVAKRVADAAASCIGDLIAWGTVFDRAGTGELALGLEAAHSRRRIVHAGGDSTGRVVAEALARAARASPAIDIVEDARITDLVLGEDAVAGVVAERRGQMTCLPARAVVLATGGVGGLYAHTTNPLGSTGSGIALAARAGAILRDMEFVQFHPTAIAVGEDPMPLASEAVRGEGAILINARGERFMEGVPGRELAPRDVVARAIFQQTVAGNEVYLDARSIGEDFLTRFPSVSAFCRRAGLDPVTQPIPVRPAAHYHMGGVAVDQSGRSSVPGLWACGEVAATGLHGANRLASNSLMEALAYARWIAEDISGREAAKAGIAVLPPSAAATRIDTDLASHARIRRLMSAAVGVIRDHAGLVAASSELEALAFAAPRLSLNADLALVGFLIARAACERTESRGGHFRRDYPAPSALQARSRSFSLADVQMHKAKFQSKPLLARSA